MKLRRVALLAVTAVVTGDWHEYIVDRPLAGRSTGRPLSNLTRLQVPGSYDVGWVRVTVTPGAPEPFAFGEASRDPYSR